MAETVYRGPAMSIGPLMGNVIAQQASGFLGGGSGQVAVVEPTDGPGIEYQANTFPDPRFGPFNKDSFKVGRIPTWLNSPYVVMADGVPQATSATAIAAAAAVASGTPMTLVTAAPGGGAAGVASVAQVSLLPMSGATAQSFPPSGSVVSVMGLDLGFTTGTTTAGSATIASIPDSSYLSVGQWISVGGAGNSGNTASLLTQVQTIASATSVTVSPIPTGSLSNAPISSANLYNTPYGSFPTLTAGSGGATGFTGAPNAVQPYSFGGVAAVYNPLEGITRNVTVTAAASATGGVIQIKGYDVYGMAMTENITAAASTTVAGNKAFKYIASATPQFTDAGHTYSVGVGNKSGFAIRADRWEYTNLFYKGTFLTSNNGFVAAVTSTATATTGDVRGTIDVSNASGFNQPFNGNTSTGRITWMMSVPLYNLVNATPINPQFLLGVTQF